MKYRVKKTTTKGGERSFYPQFRWCFIWFYCREGREFGIVVRHSQERVLQYIECDMGNAIIRRDTFRVYKDIEDDKMYMEKYYETL